MRWIGNIINNQFLFYAFLAMFCIGAIVLLTLIYIDRKNLKLFQKEEKNLLDELNRLTTEEPEEIKITKIEEPEESEKPKANLEAVLEKMQADLDKKEDVAAIFEQEQEEKAIISYQELLKSKNKTTIEPNPEIRSVIEQIQDKNYGNDICNNFEESEPIEALFEPKPIYIEVEEAKETPLKQEEPKKFKTTDFISPIYGKQENHMEYPKIPNFNELRNRNNNLELTRKFDDVEQTEGNHNDAFLNALKEFRSHLE